MRELHTDNVAASVAADLVDLVERRSPAEVHIALTGGRVGTEVTQALLPHLAGRGNVHLWFSDERFLPAMDPQRNDAVVPVDLAARVHRIPGPDAAIDPAAAAAAYAAELHLATTTRFCADNSLMDVTLLSIGPDGHVASLFPHSSVLDATVAVSGVQDSPKPPTQRVTWTYPTINASRQVWLLATGAQKRDAVASLRAGAAARDIPAAGVHGRDETRPYTDLP